MMITVSPEWKSAYPEARAGILVMQEVANPSLHPRLEAEKQALQKQLRDAYSGDDRRALESLPAVQAYSSYYRQFGKTYHVLLQLESLVFKQKNLPSASALVEAMFMAELKNQLLTAGHDLDAVKPPVTLGVSTGEERYTLLRGQEQVLKPGDLIMADEQGIISSILYGPDQRTQLKPTTRNAVFAVYAPPGIQPAYVQDHLETIRRYVQVFSPQARVAQIRVYGAEDAGV